ncbi:hypothetical protein [Aliarcobacter butzleri]|uniref:hypothetical protein n=1 Tax=Aliarcobacter butzleri TaxID=28197 RepID=UPI003AF7955B
MKKLFLVILGFFLFSINLNAAKYDKETKCPQWEQGAIVYYNGIQQNVRGATPPTEFCWDATAIEGGVYLNQTQTWYKYTDLLTTNESRIDFISSPRVYNFYSEPHYGIYVYVVVMGYKQSTPIVKFGSRYGVLVQKNDIWSPSGNIWNGNEYVFFIGKVSVNDAEYISDLDVEGSLEVYSGTNGVLKDVTYIH